MKVILLCAGYATRLRPLTDHCPKSLLPLADQPMMNYLVEKVRKIREIDQMFVVTNAKFLDAFCKWKDDFYPGESIDILNDGSTHNENRLGAVRDIAFALREKRVSDDCLILAADNFFDFDLSEFVRVAKGHCPHPTLAVYDVKDTMLAKKYGLVRVAKNQKITSFFEKPEKPETTLASTGVYFFPKENLTLIDRYLQSHQNPDAPGHYIAWLVNHSEVFAFSFQGKWYDIGDHESYERADREIRHALTS